MKQSFYVRLSVIAFCAMGVALRSGGATVGEEFFEKKIRPVLAESCYECHSASSKKLKGGLLVDNRAALLKGGDTGPAVVPGKPEKSLLLDAMAHRVEDLEMPPKKPKLPDAVLKDFERWIKDGAVWPGGETAAATTNAYGFDLAERKKRLPWLWETPKRQALPKVKDKKWPLATVDHFILARLEKEKMKPAPAAEPEIWLRRVYFALIGLPPSPEELAAFLKDGSPKAREWVVDRLLASPQFGERWGRHWLDLMRYAESRGHEGDYIIPNAYEYRDYVIRALNADVPYDAFVREHIAGDITTKPRRHPEKGFNESILGTGWAFLGEEIHSPVDTRQDENDRIDNRIDVMSKTFTGMTVACARCHDHKFDAISQKDYYAMAGFFVSSGQRLARFETLEDEKVTARQLETLNERWAAKINEKILYDAQAPVLGQLKDYLAAAAEALHMETNAPPKRNVRLRADGLASGVTNEIARLATERALNTNILSQWTVAILNAASNANDALFPLARLVFPTNSVAAANAVKTEPSLPEGARVVLDYGTVTRQEWFADGVAFGLKPVKRGELQVVSPNAGNRSDLNLTTRSAAQADSNWRELELSPGVEREPTKYGGWKRDGVMLRTPKFELTSGKIHYLVRGSGKVFAAVDSNRLVLGPLHGDLAHEWKYDDRWRWVTHDLSEYAGHRVALEFSPGNEFETAVAMIVESEKRPDDPISVGQHLATVLTERNGSSIPLAAAAYQEIFTGASKALSAASTDARMLEVASWMADRPELFSGKDGVWPEPVAGVIRDYRKEREPIMSRVQWKSRTAPAMIEGNGVDEFLLVRGKHQTPKGLVPRRFLESISGPEPITRNPGSGRKELADAMTSPENPLFARVLVNRVWHHLFGRGIVPTVDNFGWLGQRPSHPELLDDLAVSFIEEDRWSLKHLLRRLVLSRTFAMSSKPTDPKFEERDAQNILLHRMNLKRLEGEAIRDAMLAVSGRLDLRMYGVGVPLHPSQFVEARGLRSERGPLDGEGRRSIYVAARRNFLPMMMTAFDTPTPFTTVGRRNVSNVPGQMLFLMNDPFVHEQADVWANRIVTEHPNATADERIRQIYLTAFCREPSATELARCRSTLNDVAGASGEKMPTVNAWTELCHAMFGVKEFMYVR